MKPVQSKESLIKKDGQVHLVQDQDSSRCTGHDNFRKHHLFVIYSLLILSFTLHIYVIINNAIVIDNDDTLEFKETYKERGRRSVEQRNVDSSQVPSANVEFVHPKLRDSLKEDPDMVWLTSYSRVPVRFHNL